ncbi:hypothetical protein KJ885_05955 [Patescibacteria group bacterium]|nr:hypothetical protein [Patescibacteria group bacterium]
MNPAVEVKIWDWYRLQNIKVENVIVLVFPLDFLAREKAILPGVGERVHLNLCRGNEYIRMGQADIIGKRKMPLGRITDDIWARHLGPGYAEEYLEKVKEVYGSEMPFGRFSYARVVEFKIVHLETGFLALQKTKSYPAV